MHLPSTQYITRSISCTRMTNLCSALGSKALLIITNSGVHFSGKSTWKKAYGDKESNAQN